MKLLSQTLCLCLVLALSHAHHHAGHQGGEDEGHEGHDHGHHTGLLLDRCQGIEMDAVAVTEEGIPYFFKGESWTETTPRPARTNCHSFSRWSRAEYVRGAGKAEH
ncbi:unnamed protein product [Oncorhynchus mykiss]|uniref:Uncharacterized protein n=1 Tax=Oncorhynchus mykiss TaxID=8022 RepID=A0A060Y2R5_ONCMY|nr:unnamed protein product [Oncorhynchus mykiss]